MMGDLQDMSLTMCLKMPDPRTLDLLSPRQIPRGHRRLKEPGAAPHLRVLNREPQCGVWDLYGLDLTSFYNVFAYGAYALAVAIFLRR